MKKYLFIIYNGYIKDGYVLNGKVKIEQSNEPRAYIKERLGWNVVEIVSILDEVTFPQLFTEI